jgi:serine/threonine protein kinase
VTVCPYIAQHATDPFPSQSQVHLALWRGSEVAVKFLHHTTTTRAPRRRSVPDAAASDVGGGVFGERDGRDVAKNDVLGSNPETEHDGCSVSSSDDEREEEAQIQEEMHARLSFLKEAKVMAALHHPNVVFVYGVVDDSGKLGIVEEFMRSGSLRRLLNLHVREQAEMKTIAEDAGEGGVSKEEKPSSDPPSVKKKKSSGKRFLSATTRAKCALDIARGMAYLHSRYVFQ